MDNTSVTTGTASQPGQIPIRNEILYNRLKQNVDEESNPTLLKKSLLMKSFSNTKDNRGNCALEQTDLLLKMKEENDSARCKLLVVTGLCFIFMGGEIAGGYISGSIAIITDAAHMLSDVAGFLISYFAIYLGSRPANY
jgi:hypothetical protein